MNIEIQGFIIVIISIIFIYIMYQYHYYSKIEKITSTVDNRTYEVQIKEDSQEAADLIAKIRKLLITLVEHLSNLKQTQATIELCV